MGHETTVKIGISELHVLKVSMEVCLKKAFFREAKIKNGDRILGAIMFGHETLRKLGFRSFMRKAPQELEFQEARCSPNHSALKSLQKEVFRGSDSVISSFRGSTICIFLSLRLWKCFIKQWLHFTHPSNWVVCAGNAARKGAFGAFRFPAEHCQKWAFSWVVVFMDDWRDNSVTTLFGFIWFLLSVFFS